MSFTSRDWKTAFSRGQLKRASLCHGEIIMDIPYTLQTPSEKVINEIKYFAAFSALKRLLEQKKITLENCRLANVAIAEKYGVSQLHI